MLDGKKIRKKKNQFLDDNLMDLNVFVYFWKGLK